MGFTASTNTLKQSTLDFLGNTAGAKKYFYLVQYTKGDETSINLTISFIFDKISTTTQFKSSPADTATVAQQTFTMTGTSTTNWCIPVTIPAFVTHIVAALGSTGGTPTATVVIDGFPDTTVV